VALIVAGVSHQTAPIEVREKLAFRSDEALRELARLRESGIIREGVALSTCNRTEIYAVEENGDALPHIAAMLARRLGNDANSRMCAAIATWRLTFSALQPDLNP